LVSVIEMAVYEIVSNDFGHATGLREKDARCWLGTAAALETGISVGETADEW